MKKTDCRVIAILNQKGGAGKTTTTVNLAAALGELGHRVLIIDFDSSTGSTSALAVDEVYEGTAEVLCNVSHLTDVIVRSGDGDEVSLPSGVSLVCGRRNLENINEEINRRNRFIDAGAIVKNEIEAISREFDYILLDTAPNTQLPTKVCYEIADFAIIATLPQMLSIEGVAAAMSDLDAVRAYKNPSISLIGVVVTCVDGRSTNAQQQQIAFAREGLPEGAGLLPLIHRTTEVSKAAQVGKSILQTSPEHRVSNEFRSLAHEVENRIQQTRKEVECGKT